MTTGRINQVAWEPAEADARRESAQATGGGPGIRTQARDDRAAANTLARARADGHLRTRKGEHGRRRTTGHDIQTTVRCFCTSTSWKCVRNPDHGLRNARSRRRAQGASRVVAGVEANSTLTTSRGRRGQATTQGQPMLSRRSRITPTGCMHVGRERPASKRRGPTHEGTAGKRARRRRHRDRRCRRQGERAPHTVGTHAPAGALPVLLKRTLSHRMMRVSECPLGNNPIFPLTEARPTRTRAARRKSALLRLRGHQAQAPGDRHDATRLATHSATADAGASRCTGAACSVCAAVPQEAQGSARRGRPFSLADRKSVV